MLVCIVLLHLPLQNSVVLLLLSLVVAVAAAAAVAVAAGVAGVAAGVAGVAGCGCGCCCDRFVCYFCICCLVVWFFAGSKTPLKRDEREIFKNYVPIIYQLLRLKNYYFFGLRPIFYAWR